MIHIIDSWYLEANEKEFVVKRDTLKFSKSGKRQFADHTYHHSVESAISYVCKKYKLKETEKDGELNEYLKRIQELNKWFEKLLSEVKASEEIKCNQN